MYRKRVRNRVKRESIRVPDLASIDFDDPGKSRAIFQGTFARQRISSDRFLGFQRLTVGEITFRRFVLTSLLQRSDFKVM